MKLSAWKKLSATTLLALLCSAPTTINAFIAGAKASGMAATGIAYPQDAFAGAYNPAGIVEVENRFDLGFDWVRDHGNARLKYPWRNWNETEKDKIVPVKNSWKYNAFECPHFYNGEFGMNWNFSSDLYGDSWDWACGLVIYNHDYQRTTYNKPISVLGTTKPGLEYLHEVIAPVLAVRLTESHSIGLSVDVHIQRARLNGLQNFATPEFSIAPSHVTNKGYDYSSGVGVTIGWKWDFDENLTFGVTYRSKVTMTKLHKYKGFLAQQGQLNTPDQWGLGIAYRFLPCATLAFDVDWIYWHNVRSFHNSLSDSKSGHDFYYSNKHPKKFGSNDGSGFGFQNQIFYRIGIDYAFDENWTLRAGFRHTNPFIRKKQAYINLLTCDTIENYITLGVTYRYHSNEITLFYAHGFQNEIRGEDVVPYSFQPVNIKLTENKNVLGISWGYIF